MRRHIRLLVWSLMGLSMLPIHPEARKLVWKLYHLIRLFL
jgi:hypothetical protein